MEQSAKNSSAACRGRGVERIKLKGRAHLSLGADMTQPPLDVELEDLSWIGAGIVASANLPAGTPVVLLLHPVRHAPRSIRGHVLNSKPLGNDLYRIGMEFDATDGPSIKSIRQAFYPDDALG